MSLRDNNKAFMKFLKNIINKKLLFSAIAGIFLLFLASTQITHADGIFSLTDITGGFVSTLAWIASTLISAILGIVVVVEAWLISVVLNINDGIFQSTFVQTGFSISLSIANLAFVLGIIIIAIATILRNDSYGIKRILWKLVVAAILVNFGLVIAAPIFGLGNSLSHYFLNCINPAAGGCTSNSSGLASYGTFATSFAGAFQPQDNFTLQSSTAALSSASSTLQGTATGAFSAIGATFGKTFVPVFGIGFTVVNLTLIIIILLAFIVLLLIRYLYIVILVILMPFAWAAWAFPSFSKHWDKWWNEFIRWTFFSPIVLFFIYLAMLMMAGQGAPGGMNFTQYQTGGIFGPLSGFLGNMFTPIIEATLREIIFGGLIIGGMIAANSMGIKLAGNVVNGVKAGAKAGGLWVAKRGARGGLNAASSAMKPKPRVDPRTGNLYTPLTRTNRFRGSASAWLQGKAGSGAFSTKKGLANTVFSAGITGSGLFKGFSGAKKKAEYECGNCGNVISRTKPPTTKCNDCHVMPMQWTKLETED
jgi:hypothetical protein